MFEMKSSTKQNIDNSIDFFFLLILDGFQLLVSRDGNIKYNNYNQIMISIINNFLRSKRIYN